MSLYGTATHYFIMLNASGVVNFCFLFFSFCINGKSQNY